MDEFRLDGRRFGALGADFGTRHLRAVVAVARAGNFAAAAAEVGVSQPTLTRTVRRAERALGVALFSRTTRRVALTPAGAEFVPLAERLLSDLGLGLRNIRELAASERGQVVVASLMSVASGVLPEVLAVFCARHPSVLVVLREGLQAVVEAEVRTGAADLGLGDAADVGGPLTVEELGTQSFHVVLPSAHPLLARETLALADIAGQPLIAMPMEAAARRIVDGAALAAGFPLMPRITVAQYATVLNLVHHGLGIAVVPATLLAGPPMPGLASRPLSMPAVVQRLGILLRRERLPTPAAAAFLDVLREVWPPALRPPALRPPALRPPALRPPALRPPALRPPALRP